MNKTELLGKWTRGATASHYKGKFVREENIRELSQLLRHVKEAQFEKVADCSDCGLEEVVKVTTSGDKPKTFYLFVGA